MDSSEFTLATKVDAPIFSVYESFPPFSFEPVLQLAEAESRWQAAEEASRAAVQAAPDKMLQSRRSSRMDRLSIFLPNFMAIREDSKGEQDILQKKPLPYLPPTPQGHEPQPEYQSPQQSAYESSTRLPPIAPAGVRSQTPPPSSRKLQKAESPSHKLLPRASSPVASAQQIEGRKLRAASTLGPSSQSAEVERRAVSSPVHRRTGSSGSEVGKLSKRKSWMPGLGRRSRNASSEDLSSQAGAEAWINQEGRKYEYSLALLSNGSKIPELWDEKGDTLVYLFPESTGRGPSFKVSSTKLSSSFVLINYLDSAGGANNRSSDDRGSVSIEESMRNFTMQSLETPPYTPHTSTSGSHSGLSVSDGQAELLTSFDGGGPKEMHLRFPTGLTTDGTHLNPQELQSLVEIRNMFALLEGQPLVATNACPSIFRILLQVCSLLRRFEFTNMDGSTFGESVSIAFEYALMAYGLEDVRESREKTIEGLILGENMRNARLYTEAFTHAVGKYSAVKDKASPLFEEISPTTRAMLERASLDLSNRHAAAENRLLDFNFPSLFAGSAASTTSAESKFVRYAAWRNNFISMRKFMHSYLKDLHGAWPPKASSKKNAFVIGGLNRLVLKSLYADLCSLYDLKADRSDLTTRTFDGGEAEARAQDPSNAALRILLSEFDRSSPPVNPPIPFDVPMIPTISTVEPRVNQMSSKEQNKLRTRTLKSYETSLMLAKACNTDAHHDTPFLLAYKTFEAKEAKKKNSLELVDQTYGHWIFLYAVIQSLPLLVVDALGLRYTEGVEYFLCMPPPGNMSWMEDAPKTAWYGVAGGQQMVSLPSHLVENGVEAVYRRSHCWIAAEMWIGHANGEVEDEAFLAPQLSPLAPPPGFGEDYGFNPPSRGRDSSLGANLTPTAREGGSRSRSRQSARKSIAIGLERLPIPTGGSASPTVSGMSPATNGHRRDSSWNRPRTPQTTEITGATFDDILGTQPVVEGKKGKGKKK